MRHYTTLFDSKYLPQGLALYESLKKHSSEPFTLHVLAMDEDCLHELYRVAGEDEELSIIPIESLERSILKGIRETRTHQEFCWTCASQLSEYLLKSGLPEVTYCDSDIWFMDDPEIVFAEIGERSVGVIPHRFADNADRPRLEKSGRFNVSLVYFKNDATGQACLSKWARQCREQCSAKSCGDQLHLNDWPEEYGDQCAIINNIGVGVAPWNLSSYKVTADADGVYVDGTRICMFHFHELRQRPDGKFFLSHYRLRQEDKDLIYSQYVSACESSMAGIDQHSSCGKSEHIKPGKVYPFGPPTAEEKGSLHCA